jgi:hypothetical protein
MSLNCNQQRAYCSTLRLYMTVEGHGGMILAGENRRNRRKICPSASLSTTHPTWTEPGPNLALRGERPVTSRPSHVTAQGDFIVFMERYLNRFGKSLVKPGGESCSLSQEPGSDSCAQLYNWTHRIKYVQFTVLPDGFWEIWKSIECVQACLIQMYSHMHAAEF